MENLPRVSRLFIRDMEQHVQRRRDGLSGDSSRSDRRPEHLICQCLILLIGFISERLVSVVNPEPYRLFMKR